MVTYLYFLNCSYLFLPLYFIIIILVDLRNVLCSCTESSSVTDTARLRWWFLASPARDFLADFVPVGILLYIAWVMPGLHSFSISALVAFLASLLLHVLFDSRVYTKHRSQAVVWPMHETGLQFEFD